MFILYRNLILHFVIQVVLYQILTHQMIQHLLQSQQRQKLQPQKQRQRQKLQPQKQRQRQKLQPQKQRLHLQSQQRLVLHQVHLVQHLLQSQQVQKHLYNIV